MVILAMSSAVGAATRPPAVAGSFYPGGAAELRAEVAALLAAVEGSRSRGAKVALSIDGTKKSGRLVCDLPLPRGLFRRELEIQGIGYRAQIQGKRLEMALGFSHPVIYPIPSDVEIAVDQKAGRITVTGTDKQRVGQVAAEIRGFKPPEPYKGKGVRYAGEHVKHKVGKTGA